MIAGKRIIFVDSITDLTRQAMAWAKTRPEAFQREDRQARHPRRLRAARPRGHRPAEAPAARAGQDGDLRRHPRASPTSSTGHLAAADGRRQGRPRAARHRRPGDLDEPVRARAPERGDGWRHDPDQAARSAASSAAPAIPSACRPRIAPAVSTSPSRPTSARCSPRSTPPERSSTMSFDMNDAEPQKSGELIPDGTFAKVTMTIRRAASTATARSTRGCSRPPTPGSDVLMLDAEFTVVEGRTPGASSGRPSPSRAASSTRRASRSAGRSPRASSGR
jgi:hypothetical protein